MKQLVFSFLIAGNAFTQTPVDYAKWQMGNHVGFQLGGAIQNYQNGPSWAPIDNKWTFEGDSVVVCNTAALKTRINQTGLSIVRLNHDGINYIVSQQLKGIGWINTETRTSQWIDSTMDWSGVAAGDSIITWSVVSPGVDYRVAKWNGQVPHSIFYKPAFLDSAIILYNQRSDSLDIALANVMIYNISASCDSHDVAIGDVPGRRLKRIGGLNYSLIAQYMHYPGSDTLPQVPVRQYWEKRGTDLFCLEYVMMSELKRLHQEYPLSQLWHNIEISISTDKVDIDCGILREGSGGNNEAGRWHQVKLEGVGLNDFSFITIFNALDDSLPDNAITDSAKVLFTRFDDNTSSDDTLTITVNRLLRLWTEGNDSTSISGVDASDGEGSWNDANQGTTAWTTPGAKSDGDDRDSNRDTILTVIGFGINDGVDHTYYFRPSSVDSMRTAEGNRGWLWEWIIPTGGAFVNYIYYSDDDDTQSNRPTATIWYQLATGGNNVMVRQ